MTLRAKPVGRRSGRFDRDGGDRRTFLVNLGFTLAIVLSLLILVGYAAWSFWDDHNGAAATINGVTLTKDDLRERFRVEAFRLNYTEARIETLKTLGRLSEAQAAQQLAFLAQRKETLGPISLGRMVDIELQSQLAREAGISVTDADVEAQFLKEKTMLEERHIWVIEIAPENDPATGEPGAAQEAKARGDAEGALAQLRAGKPWDEVAKSVSTAASAPQAGDLGWAEKNVGLDEAFLEAVFAVAIDAPTAVVEGADGILRIGRATEIAAEKLDETYEAQIEEAGMTLVEYRAAVRADVVREKLNDKVVADLSKPSLQRHVLQIYLPEVAPSLDGVKVRHILFSPKDDPAGARDLPKADPAWRAAEDEARAAYEALKDDISKFDDLARTMSDESSAAQTGGKQPFYSPTSAIDAAFATAIFEEGLKPGRLLVPVETSFGWHVIQVLRPYGDGDEAWLKGIRQQILDGADFGSLARDQGEGAEAERSGDIEWIARETLDAIKEEAIFGAAVDGVTDVLNVPQDGVYLWQVLGEEVRTPTADQIAIFESNGFENWYTARYEEADVDTQPSAASAAGS
jgi:parvulin-like peptidyl-prolyl isomerase